MERLFQECISGCTMRSCPPPELLPCCEWRDTGCCSALQSLAWCGKAELFVFVTVFRLRAGCQPSLRHWFNSASFIYMLSFELALDLELVLDLKLRCVQETLSHSPRRVMNTGWLLQVSNLLDLGSFTCFLVFWLYHAPAVIQSTGRQRNAGARSISSWQNSAFTSNVGVLGKESTWQYLAFNSPNCCNALGLFPWNVQRKTWAYGSATWTTGVGCWMSSTAGISQAARGFKSRASKCIYCSLQASWTKAVYYLAVGQ